MTTTPNRLLWRQENEELQLRLARSNKHLMRLRLEKQYYYS